MVFERKSSKISIVLRKQKEWREPVTMKRIIESYKQNTILQLLATHIIIIVITIFILGTGFGYAFKIVKDDSYISYQNMLSHSADIIDEEIKKMQVLALQMTQNGYVQAYAGESEDPAEDIISMLRIRDDIALLTKIHNVEMIDSFYVYFRNKDKILYESSLYTVELFSKYALDKGMTLEEWRTDILSPEQREAFFYRKDDTLMYVYPFSGDFFGENQGVIVFCIDNKFFRKLLEFKGSENTWIGIYDKQFQTIWTDGEIADSRIPTEQELTDQGIDGYTEHKGDSIFQVFSNTFGWRYVLIMNRQVTLQKLLLLEKIVFLLAGLTISIGFGISLYMSILRGRSINKAIVAISSSGKQQGNLQNIGEAVTDILQDHEELLGAMERERPLLQKAFFSDLVKGEFNTEEQLRISSASVGVTLQKGAYILCSMELFANNDDYTIDKQTLEESQIIMQLLENRLAELWGEGIYFIKRNYRILLIVFPLRETEDEINQLIVKMRKWLLEEYKTETIWGYSRTYNEYLLMWKAAEESLNALTHCTENQPIVEYRYELENMDEFYFPEMAMDKLREGVLAGNKEEIQVVLTILEEENCRIRRLSRKQFIKLNQKIMEFIRETAGEDETAKEYTDWHIMRLNKVIMESEISGEEYFRRLTQVCENMCKQNMAKTNQQKKDMIEDVKVYLQQNYMDSGLCLAQIGSVFRVSEGYLSSLFKEYAGVNFTEYLEDIRIKKACELLKEHYGTVNEVAEAVGYNSAQVFRRAFKRVMGISPKDAR